MSILHISPIPPAAAQHGAAGHLDIKIAAFQRDDAAHRVAADEAAAVDADETGGGELAFDRGQRRAVKQRLAAPRDFHIIGGGGDMLDLIDRQMVGDRAVADRER